MKSTRKRYGRTQHGGVNTTGHRKNERPLSTRRWVHLVLKSDKARGSLSFLQPKNRAIVNTVISSKAKKFGVKVAEFVNVGDHIHFKIKVSSREGFQKFLKASTTLIARQITGAKKGKPFGRFWQGLAFTRVLTSSLEELRLSKYLDANLIERKFGYHARENFLKEFRAWIYRERIRSKHLASIGS